MLMLTCEARNYRIIFISKYKCLYVTAFVHTTNKCNSENKLLDIPMYASCLFLVHRKTLLDVFVVNCLLFVSCHFIKIRSWLLIWWIRILPKNYRPELTIFFYLFKISLFNLLENISSITMSDRIIVFFKNLKNNTDPIRTFEVSLKSSSF